MKDALAGLLGVMLALTLVALMGQLIGATLSATTSAPTIDSSLGNLATVASGYVAGLIARWYGVDAPTAASVGFLKWLESLWPTNIKDFLGLVFVLAYFGISAAALIAWMTHPTVTPGLLQSQVVLAVGLIAAIMSGVFKN